MTLCIRLLNITPLTERLELFLEESLSTLQVVWRVNAHRLNVCDSHLDAIAVLEPAQLLQALCQFERALWQTGNLGEHFEPIGIDAQVLQEGEVLQPFIGLESLT